MTAQNDSLLSHLHRAADRELGNRLLDMVDIVRTRDTSRTTEFVNPQQRNIAENLLKQLTGINFKVAGGYYQAERKRILLFPDYLFPDHQEVPLSFIKVSGNFDFVNVSHRDFLGALLALGIKKSLIGDILVHENYAQIVLAPEILPEVKLNLDYVNEVPVEISEISSEDLIFKPRNSKEILATVASLRLDAVISAGFGDSRTKSSSQITAGQVKLNWVPESDPAADVEIGDVISIRGRGRLIVAEDRGISNSGRIKLTIERIT